MLIILSSALFIWRKIQMPMKRINGKKKQIFIDLADVPPQLPIRRSGGKDVTSKYRGVCFNKEM
jgi:hypothetical protein